MEIQALLGPGYDGEALGVAAPAIFLDTLASIGGAESLRFLADWRAAQDLSPWYIKQVSRTLASIRRRTGDVHLGSLSVLPESDRAGGLSPTVLEGALSGESEAETSAPAEISGVRRPKQRS